MEEIKTNYHWNSLDFDYSLNPSELLVYYLYRYRIEVKNKKEASIREDITSIKSYAKKLGRNLEDVYETSKRK